MRALLFASGVVLAAGQPAAAAPDLCRQDFEACVATCDADFPKGSAQHDNCTAVCRQQHENCDRIMNTPNAAQPADSGSGQKEGAVKQ